MCVVLSAAKLSVCVHLRQTPGTTWTTLTLLRFPLHVVSSFPTSLLVAKKMAAGRKLQSRTWVHSSRAFRLPLGPSWSRATHHTTTWAPHLLFMLMINSPSVTNPATRLLLAHMPHLHLVHFEIKKNNISDILQGWLVHTYGICVSIKKTKHLHTSEDVGKRPVIPKPSGGSMIYERSTASAK